MQSHTLYRTAILAIFNFLIVLLLLPDVAFAAMAPEGIVQDANWAFAADPGDIRSWTYAPDPSSSSVYTEHLFNQTYWYRLNGQTTTQSASMLTNGWDSFLQSEPNKLTVNIGSISIGDPIELTVNYSLKGGTSPNSSLIEQTMSITNLSTMDDIDLSWFVYTNFNINGTETDQSASLVNPRTIRQQDGNLIGEFRILGTPDKTPDHWEIGTPDVLGYGFTSGNIAVLADQNNSLGNEDLSHAFQWDITIPKGGAFQLTQELEIFSLTELLTPGKVQDNPILPGSSITPPGSGSTPGPTPGPWTFDNFSVTKGFFSWLDPDIAIGYDYYISSGPYFESVLLPMGIGDNQFYLYLFDENTGKYFDSPYATLFGGVPYNFLAINTLGLNRFRIMGIEESAGLDPLDPTAFVTGLKFTESGIAAGMQMTPIVKSTTSSVTEPTTMLLLGLGLIGITGVRRKLK